jgi:hypothetical protein
MSSREHVAMTEKDTFGIEKLLRPSLSYSHPREVLADQELGLNEKRAVLAAWASDAGRLQAYRGANSGNWNGVS